MSHFDAHIVGRLEEGFAVLAAYPSKWLAVMEDFVSTAEAEKLYASLFPVVEEVGEGADVREARISFRTDYVGIMDARLAPAPQSPGGGPAHYPAIIVDMASESTEATLGNRHVRERSTVEIMIISKTKAEVRALHRAAKFILLDSTVWFKRLGYPSLQIRDANDIRPMEAAAGGLHPNFLGLMQRAFRVEAMMTVITPDIFGDVVIPQKRPTVYQESGTDEFGEPGQAKPR